MSEWKALDILHHAHQVGLEKMKAMEAAINALKSGQTDAAVAQFKPLRVFFDGELRTHFRQEEEALFPAISQAIGPMGPVMVMTDEHKSLWQAIDALEEELDGLGAGTTRETKEAVQAASYILCALRSHIQKEDEMLFPLANAQLGEIAKKKVSDAIVDTAAASGMR